MKPLLSIQYLRAFAALAVVVFHACQWSDVDFDIGAGGVDIFFVISGFLMWAITQDPAVTPAGFLWRRVTRVAPLYWISTLALIGLVVAAGPGLIPQVKLEPSHVVLSLLFVPHLDPAGLPFPLLPPGWSLSYEAILYLIFAAALLGPRHWRFGVVLTSLVVIILLGLVVRPLFPLFANPMMLEFAAGVVMAKFMGDGYRPGPALSWSLIGVGLVAFVLLRLFGIHSDIQRWFLWGAPSVLIVIGALGVEAGGRLPRSDALKRVGDASYSIYLCHWPVIAAAAKLAGNSNPWLFVPLTVAASVAAGLAVRPAVEKPMIGLFRSSRRMPGPRSNVSEQVE